MTQLWKFMIILVAASTTLASAACTPDHTDTTGVTDEQQAYTIQFKDTDEQRYRDQIARCQTQVTEMIGNRGLCRNLTYFYSIDCMTLGESVLADLITQYRTKGWNLAVECIPIKMEETGTFHGTMQVRGRPPVDSIGWMCAQVHDESAWHYRSACYVSYDVFEGRRLGIYAAAVRNTGLLAWIRPVSCPMKLCLLRFDLSSPPHE